MTDRHASTARAAGAYIAEHTYGPGCTPHETIWGVTGCEAIP